MLENNDLNKEKITVLTKAVARLEAKESKFIFCVPDSAGPSASVYELYTHANVLKNMGYNVTMMTESSDLKAPEWIEPSLTDIKHVLITDSKINVSPDDFMIIPEVFTNIMEQTKNLPCKKICLLQSFDYMLNGLIPGTDFELFGINDVITTSETLRTMLNTFYGEKYKVETYDIGIPDYFKPSEMPQKPVISIVGRNSNDISKVIKLFFSKYPHLKWVTFDPLLTNTKPPTQLDRIDFAERLRNNFAAVWIDRIASFGTFPIECMKSGVIPIFIVPDIEPEYLQDASKKYVEAGMYTSNIYDIPVMIGDLLTKFIDDSIPDQIYETMSAIADRYTMDKSEKQLTEIYSKYVEERISFLKNALNN
jgi:hypothetical protein